MDEYIKAEIRSHKRAFERWSLDESVIVPMKIEIIEDLAEQHDCPYSMIEDWDGL